MVPEPPPGQRHCLSVEAQRRAFPQRRQFDYLVLSDLTRAIARHASGIMGRVLDYGCGLKPYRPLFTQATEYVGADFPGNPWADVCLDPTGGLPADLGEFDAVVSFQVLEHVPECGDYLSACRRALEKRKGKLLLTTHGIWEYHPGPRDLYRWTHEGLVHRIEHFGFQTEAVEPVTTGLRSVLQVVASRIRRGRVPTRPLRELCYWTIGCLGDWFGEARDRERRLTDFPICYVYLGRCEP